MLVAMVQTLDQKTGNFAFNDMFFFDTLNDIYEFVKGETMKYHIIGMVWSSDTERRLPIVFEYRFNEEGIPNVKVKEDKKLIAEFKFNSDEPDYLLMVKKKRRK